MSVKQHPRFAFLRFAPRLVCEILAVAVVFRYLQRPPPPHHNLQQPGLNPRCCGPGCRETLSQAAAHYDVAYFKWQTKLGLEKAQSNDFNTLFAVSPNDTVADLGAGGGHILATLNAKRKIAVELNDYARRQIKRKYPDIESFRFVEDLADQSVDIFYSTSVIEHIECPLTELAELYRKVRPGGRFIVGIKNEGVQYLREYRTGDTDMHLYTWNALLLGNLVASAGFRVERVLPERDRALQTAKTWNESHVASYHAFIYHWVFAVKD